MKKIFKGFQLISINIHHFLMMQSLSYKEYMLLCCGMVMFFEHIESCNPEEQLLIILSRSCQIVGPTSPAGKCPLDIL